MCLETAIDIQAINVISESEMQTLKNDNRNLEAILLTFRLFCFKILITWCEAKSRYFAGPFSIGLRRKISIQK